MIKQKTKNLVLTLNIIPKIILDSTTCLKQAKVIQKLFYRPVSFGNIKQLFTILVFEALMSSFLGEQIAYSGAILTLVEVLKIAIYFINIILN